MRQLTILYDANCAFCRRCRAWLEHQPKYMALAFVAQGSDEAKARWPGVAESAEPEELLAIDDRGGVYREHRAWIMVLYALRRYRSLSLRLAQPQMQPLARRAVHFIARHRQGISRFVRDDQLIAGAAEEPRTNCATSCDETTGRLRRARKAAHPQGRPPQRQRQEATAARVHHS